MVEISVFYSIHKQQLEIVAYSLSEWYIIRVQLRNVNR